MHNIEMKAGWYEVREHFHKEWRDEHREYGCDDCNKKCLAQKLQHQLFFGTADGFSNANFFCALRSLRSSEIDKIDTGNQ